MTVAMKSELFLVMCLFFISGKCQSKNDQKKIIDLVKMWSSEIGRQLTELSRTMTRLEHAEKSFRPLETKLMKETPEILVHDIASHISELMDTKAEAVKNIAEYAEFLSYHRSNESLFENGTYYFFNSDNITKSARDQIREEEIANDILSAECHWACAQANVSFLSNNKFSYTHNRDALFKRRRHERGKECSCSRLTDMDRPPRSYLNLPLEYDPKFDDYVNLNLSIAKLALNVYQREQSVLEGLKWSEALDLVFKDNLAKDPSLTWQYFASPRGFLRHFPAIKWSQERYDRTYDFRTRTWYTEAITSPKDIIILLDRSGSMKGTRKALSQQIVNQILDTLNDNDFVNIYTFTNTTEPLVDCFNDTLFQANEENLRLLRENLPVYEEEDVADLSVGFKKAFYILENFRHTQTSARCNQAIILITEGIDYEYDKKMFEIHNWKKDFPIRIFSFQVGIDINDAIELEWIACANMGYWGNMTHMGDIREKMLSYLNVMSRPINYNGNTKNKENRKYIWSYLHVDLTDRRLSNWLWKKFEGIRQREVFLDHVKRDFFKKKKFFSSTKHMLLEESHEYEKYNKKIKYKYMTTVSLPVYGRREGEVELIGVAGIDVPIHLFKAQIPFDRLGVNGYAFIVTNNGYILIHPDHRTEFENILKPTFNRVDILEVEVLDDNRKPRLFGESVVKLREKLVNQNESISITLNVKYPLNDMRRVMLAKRHYYYSKIGPFTLGIVLPDKYGYVKINKTRIQKPPLEQIYRSLVGSNNWTVHPDWIYCQKCEDDTPEGKVRNAFSTKENSPLLNALFDDLVATTWFDTENANHYRYVLEYQVHKIFLATHSGLTRWKTFSDPETEQDPFEKRETRAIDSDWYRRTVELNYAEENVFIYSVPFETSEFLERTYVKTGLKPKLSKVRKMTRSPLLDLGSDQSKDIIIELDEMSDLEDPEVEQAVSSTIEENKNMLTYSFFGYENNTMITSTKAIFVGEEKMKTPVAVVGLQFNHREIYEIYNDITTKCGQAEDKPCRITCKIKRLNCYILDNNAYIVLSDEPEYIGRYIGDIRADIMADMIEDGVYIPTKMFDYQAICQKIPPEPIPEEERNKLRKERWAKERARAKAAADAAASNSASAYNKVIDHVISISTWLWQVMIFFIQMVYSQRAYQTINPEMIAFNKLAIVKTVPTPCDHSMWLFNVNKSKVFPISPYKERTNKFLCDWPYVVDKIPNTNLLFLATNDFGPCKDRSTAIYSTEPKEIIYNTSLPCYIATMNNYTRRMYMDCYNRNKQEDILNQRSRAYCGHSWK